MTFGRPSLRVDLGLTLQVADHETSEDGHDHLGFELDDILGQRVDARPDLPRHRDAVLRVLQLSSLSTTNKHNLLNLLMGTGNYSATSNNMKLVHWPLMNGLLHLVQRGWDWAGPLPAQTPPRCTKCNSPPINGQCTNQCSMFNSV